jgi:hypothetical protein
MARLETVFLRTLRGLDANQLDEITADGHAFASRRWFELLESLDLNEITQGEVELAFATVYVDGNPELIQPIMRARGSGIHFLYSLRRFYFETWIEEAVRLRPGKRNAFARIFAGVHKFRQALELAGSPLDDCWFVGSPLSLRCHPAVSPSASASRLSLLERLIADLQRLSRATRRPLCFLGVEGLNPIDPWRTALRRTGCAETFFGYDNLIRVESFETFGDYLESLGRTARRAARNELKIARREGIDVRIVDDFAGLGRSFAAMDESGSPASRSVDFRHTAESLRSVSKNCGNLTEAAVAFRQDEPVGYSVLLESRRRGEMWTYRTGQSAPGDCSAAALRSAVGIYAPLRRAIGLGYRRLWLGPGDGKCKRLRGAEQIPLYSYFYFPRRFDRWTLQRYLRVWGRIARKQLDRSLDRASTDSSKRPTKAPHHG